MKKKGLPSTILMYYVYFIKSKKYNETYIGSTNNLRRRLSEHNNGIEISTKRYKPWQLIYYEAYRSEKDAREREMKLKNHGNAVRELRKRIHRGLKNGERGLPRTIFRKNGAGFTLLEVVIALAILSIGLLALLRAIPVGLEASGRGHDVTVALLLAEHKLEELRYSPWPPLSSDDGTFGPPGDNFDWEIATVATVTAPTYLREVSVSVYWPAAAGDSSDRSKQRRVNVKTYLAKYSN